ncbi:MAG: MarR family transcriptional regulator [Corynebacterium sp.]|nr:MarR family transcriptional regulator [Corynebacterium sp.]
MFVVLARYRGTQRRKADIIRDAATAFARMVPAENIEIVGVDEFQLHIAETDTAVAVCTALLAPGDWAVALSYNTSVEFCRKILGMRATPGTVKVRFQPDTANWASDISASFELLAFVLRKRTAEGREATALVRSGMSQIEAAGELGISKQAMSQRLQAAGWRAEQAGYGQAVSLLRRAHVDLAGSY